MPISWLYRRLVRPALFKHESEAIHDWTLQMLAQISRNDFLCDALASFFGAPEMRVEVSGLSFPNPIGLGAGMDKYAVALNAWAALGFGFCELGGVTWHAQPGNPPPRLFRALADEALINRMGFNNPGADAMALKLAEWRKAGRWPNHPVGINLGKSKVTPLDRAAEDYAASLSVLWSHGDFFVVNVSSPNTPNLRQLQDRSALDEILEAVQKTNAHQSQVSGNKNLKPEISRFKTRIPIRQKPIFIKVAPDLSFEALDEILDLAERHGIAGLVATNTTTSRPKTNDPKLQRIYAEPGGLSGRPLRQRSTEMIRHIFRQSGGALPIIGVGGIFDAADAWEKITAGASLVQIYTGLIYQGPSLVRDIVCGLRERMAEAGLKKIQEAVGLRQI